MAPSPAGGGHQFIRALTQVLARSGVRIEFNRISGGTPSCLFNSFNFEFARLERFARDDVHMVHRVDGPIGVYRGFDNGTDRRIAEINQRLADVTVFQSVYSLEKHRELGFDLARPTVITNAPDPTIFYPPPSRGHEDRRIRIVASSWSDNPRKGAGALLWLDRHLDGDRFEVTFVGRTSLELARVRVIPPVPSRALADLLRAQDVYLAASEDDPCSNALLEALACDLPAIFRRSGGHPELVGAAGVGFDDVEEIPDALERLVGALDDYRAAISVPRLSEVADRYLETLAP